MCGRGIRQRKGHDGIYEWWVRFGDEELLCEVILWGVPGEIWDGMEGVVDFLQD